MDNGKDGKENEDLAETLAHGTTAGSTAFGEELVAPPDEPRRFVGDAPQEQATW